MENQLQYLTLYSGAANEDIHSNDYRLSNFGNQVVKRTVDVVISTLVITLIFPWLILLISLAIRLNSKGPIFFIQKRTGRNNSTFKCLKFRSMILNGDSDFQQTSRNDVRVTLVGRFLRRTSLDELPQFLNVLQGTMSIVGPRPHMYKLTDQYCKLIPQYEKRLMLRPGITGWAQVNGARGEIQNFSQLRKRLDYDLQYIQNWTLKWDIQIMFSTFFKLIIGDKNAF